MSKFNEEEENKLEYTNVYQDYVQLMEQILDSMLKKSTYEYSDEKVEAFYSTFK